MSDTELRAVHRLIQQPDYIALREDAVIEKLLDEQAKWDAENVQDRFYGGRLS